MVAKFQMPVKRSPKTDPQQYRLYRMEQECFGGMWRGKMTLKAIRSLANAVCKNYRVSPVKIKFKDLGGWAGQCWLHARIDIDPKKRAALSIICIAHELAHHVHNQLVSDEVLIQQEPHGAEFLACYMSVLDTIRIVPLAGTRAIFKNYKLRYIDPGDNNSLTTLTKRISKLQK